jgi:hypothetical protein
MNKRLTTIALFLALTFSGCGTSTEYPKENYTSEIAVNAVLVQRVREEQEDTVVKVDRKNCQHCKGSGILKSGDGLSKEVCPYCEVKTSVGVESTTAPVDIRCCQDCVCGENCQCTYPGQCLILKHRGWAVTVVDDNGERTYIPQDTMGTQYDPYSLLTPAQRASRVYDKYKYPIRVNTLGEEITTANKNTTQSSCPSCRN